MIFLRTKIENFQNEYEIITKNNAGGEISLYNTEYIQNLKYSDLNKIREIINANNLSTLVHLPMYSLDIGTKDRFIKEYSLNILIKSLDIANVLNAKKAVFHMGFNPLNPKKVRNIWYNNFKYEFKKIIEISNQYNIEINVENIWDRDDEIFEKLITDFPDVKLCFDIGHAQAYLNNMKSSDFIIKYKKHITHFHLHDNMLNEDQHLHLGKGKIDFKAYFEIIKENIENYTITLETDLDEEISNDILKTKKLIGSDILWMNLLNTKMGLKKLKK